MKKILLISLVLIFIGLSVYSDGIQLGDFPSGKWVDARWDAIWDFSSGSIRIWDPMGELIYSFETKTIEDFKVMPGGEGLELSFYCAETAKKYKFIKPLTNMDLKLVIDKDNGTHYETNLPSQR